MPDSYICLAILFILYSLKRRAFMVVNRILWVMVGACVPFLIFGIVCLIKCAFLAFGRLSI
ncbi:MAG: hypothetical protein HW390_1330 [Candidatus Brocadiaceae bacterium]|nr:hypothetical protein [Candidatus Brocadiaceae bacterium]